ncbi:MAG: hypothetical protein II830_02245 [Alphaproteobacteria bacterium]|nr:hypothetical protein [Alphaproteobacteria bacterium]
MPIDLLTSLIPNEKQALWKLYLNFLYAETKRFEFEKSKVAIKEEKIRLLEKVLRCNTLAKNNIIAELQKGFINENLSVSLLTDWLVVWRYSAITEPPLNEKRISDIIGTAASPLARMIMALNNENPSIYLPFSSLVSAVLFLYIKHNNHPILKGCKWRLSQQLSKLKGWLKNAEILLNVVSSKRLKFKIALLINRLKIFQQAFQNNKQYQIGILDEIKIILYSVWQFMTIRHKSVIIRGL